MTIRLAEHMRNIKRHPFVSGYLINSAGGVTLAGCDTEAEAQAAQRAFEQVLAPRFTRDEAIAIVKEARERHNIEDSFALPEERAERDTGIRLALEALAAAGVFAPCDLCEGTGKGAVVRSKGFWHEPDSCCKCSPTMSDKLDAAGIR